MIHIENKRKCKVCGCIEDNTPKFYVEKGLCNKHYIQMYRYGEIRDDKPSFKIEHVCSVCGDTTGKFGICYVEGELCGKSLCVKHYGQMQKDGKITDRFISQNKKERVCYICQKTKQDTEILYNPNDGNMYCRRHYDQIYRFGNILEETVYDRNKYEIKDNHVEIILKNKKHIEVARTLIDFKHLERVIAHKWTLGSWGYACAVINNKFCMLQNYILEIGGLIDHINRNPLDNREINLIISNKSLNAINCDIRKNNKTGVTGVSYCEKLSLYRAYINWEGKRIELGWFKKINEAITSRLKKEYELLGNLSPQRHLFKEYGIEVHA